MHFWTCIWARQCHPAFLSAPWTLAPSCCSGNSRGRRLDGACTQTHTNPTNLQLQKILQPNTWSREAAGGWCFWPALLSPSKMNLWLGGRWNEKSKFLILNQRLYFQMFIYFLIFLFVWNFCAEHCVRLEKMILLVLKASWRKYGSN